MAESGKVNEHYRMYKPSSLTIIAVIFAESVYVDSRVAHGGHSQRVPLAWSGSHVTISGNNISMPITMAIHPMNGITPM